MAFTRIALGLLALALTRAANAQRLTGTLKKIKDTGAITIGYRETSIPFSYLDESNKPVGFAMDICAKIVDAVKKELGDNKIHTKYVSVTSSTRVPLIATLPAHLE